MEGVTDDPFWEGQPCGQFGALHLLRSRPKREDEKTAEPNMAVKLDANGGLTKWTCKGRFALWRLLVIPFASREPHERWVNSPSNLALRSKASIVHPTCTLYVAFLPWSCKAVLFVCHGARRVDPQPTSNR